MKSMQPGLHPVDVTDMSHDCHQAVMPRFHTDTIAVANREKKMNRCFEKDGESGMSSTTWEKQALQAVINHDGMTFMPIDGNPRHGLLVINQAYTDDSGLRGQGMRSQAAQGVNVIEVFERLGQWRVMPRPRYDRNINVPHSAETGREGGDPARSRVATSVIRRHGGGVAGT
jgi:secreted PhoX family phosphatase